MGWDWMGLGVGWAGVFLLPLAFGAATLPGAALGGRLACSVPREVAGRGAGVAFSALATPLALWRFVPVGSGDLLACAGTWMQELDRRDEMLKWSYSSAGSCVLVRPRTLGLERCNWAS